MPNKEFDGSMDAGYCTLLLRVIQPALMPPFCNKQALHHHLLEPDGVCITFPVVY